MGSRVRVAAVAVADHAARDGGREVRSEAANGPEERLEIRAPRRVERFEERVETVGTL
jgi:hypothetical protein